MGTTPNSTIRANNPHAIGTRDWIAYNSPNIFNASQGPAHTNYRTPYGVSQRTTVGSFARPIGPDGNPIHSSNASGMERYATGNDPYGRITYNWGTPFGSDTLGDGPGGMPPGYPPGGGSGSGSGSGSGGGAAVPDYSQWGGWAAQAKPGMYGFTPLEQTYLDWDPSMFDRANEGITQGMADARKRGGTAFDLAAQQYMNYQDPYASGPKAYSPGVDPALMASMQAWGGAGSGEAMRQQNYANTADAAMGSIYDLLGNVGRQYNTDNLNAVQGDRMQFDQGMDMAGNELRLGSDMARARSYGDWRNRDNDARNATAMANWGRQNQVGDTNVATTNQWNSDVLDAILGMIGSGGTGIPQAGNALSQFITMPQYGGV